MKGPHLRKWRQLKIKKTAASTETQLQEKVLAKFGGVEELRRDAIQWGLDPSYTAVNDMEPNGSRCGACKRL